MNPYYLYNSYQKQLQQSSCSPKEAFMFSEWVWLFLKEYTEAAVTTSQLAEKVNCFISSQKYKYGCTQRELSECSNALRLLLPLLNPKQKQTEP